MATGIARRSLRINGIDLRVQVDGPDGAPWLVLSNSLGCTLEMWEPQIAAFSREFRLLRYDTRGHGGSSVPPRPYSVEQLGTDVLGLLDVLGVERARYCGLSMGGSTGMWLAVNAPRRIERLVLCNTTPWLGPPAAMNARIETLLRDGMPALVDGILERWFTVDFRAREPFAVDRIREMLLATPVEGYAGCCAALRDMDQRASLRQIAAPTLVVAGTHDPAPTPEAARAWAATIPGARVLELPAAHLSNLGAAEPFTRQVLEFLRAPPAGQATCSRAAPGALGSA